jgi:ferredoxin-nitrite reductase
MGLDAFVADVEKRLPKKLRRIALDECGPRPAVVKHGHVGFHPQKQPDLNYVGVVFPVGRITCEQMRQAAAIADRHGSGTIRLTVWQNLIISDIPTAKIDAVKSELAEAGLGWTATGIKGGLIACTGNAGCRFAAANTKKHAIQIADYLESKLTLDQPINIHLTGCHHSCAQHYIGDIGLLATKVPVGEEMVEGYHIYVGGGYGSKQGVAKELFRNVIADDAPATIERMLQSYLAHRNPSHETFVDFVNRHPADQLVTLVETVKEA